MGWDSLGVSDLPRMMLACTSQGKPGWRAAEGRPQDSSGLRVLDYKMGLRAKTTVEAQC